MERRAHLLVANSRCLFCDGLRALLERGGRFDVTCAASLQEAIEVARQPPPVDLALLEIEMAAADGFGGMRCLIGAEKPRPVAVIAGDADRPLAQTAFEMGAAGIVLSTSSGEAMLQGIRMMMHGERYVPDRFNAEAGQAAIAKPAGGLQAPAVRFTRREQEILDLLARGMSNKEIARELGIGPMTVAMHLTAVFRKLGVSSRTQAVMAIR